MTGVDTIGVVGLGAMGAGILEVFAKQGLHAVAVEIDQAALERGQAILKASLARAVERGRMEATAADEVFDSINWTSRRISSADLMPCVSRRRSLLRTRVRCLSRKSQRPRLDLSA